MFSVLFLPMIISALTYDDPCQKQCDQPGFVCQNNRCRCDEKQRLFWTGARCFPCPNSWTISETACIAYYHTKATWAVAQSTCRSAKAELISFRRPDIVQLLYQLQYRVERRKRGINYTDAVRGWVGARVKDFPKAVYEWLDPSLQLFNDKDPWWCKTNTQHMGYVYPYNEPTRWTKNGEQEACVMYWRGEPNPQVVCLDDQLCSAQYEFVCELSESTAKQYHGPPPSQLSHTTKSASQPIMSGGSNPAASESKKSNKTLIIIIGVVVGILLLIALLLGLFCYCRRRKSAVNIRNSKATIPSYVSDVNDVQPVPVAKAPPIVPEPVKIPEEPTPNLGPQKINNKRGGFTKQQFDEFD